MPAVASDVCSWLTKTLDATARVAAPNPKAGVERDVDSFILPKAEREPVLGMRVPATTEVLLISIDAQAHVRRASQGLSKRVGPSNKQQPRTRRFVWHDRL